MTIVSACVLCAALIFGTFSPARASANDAAGASVYSPEAKEDKIDNEKIEYQLAGGFEYAKSPVITKARKKMFNKAFKKFVGSTVVPVAYLGSQVVAGSRHVYLCRSKTATKDAKEYYCFVTLFKNLKGKVSIEKIVDTEVETNINGLDGGWYQPKSAKLTKTVKKAFNKALKGLVGVDYTPVAVIAKQVVAGYNYAVLCRSKVVYPGAEEGFSIVTLYKGVNGKVELSDIKKLPNISGNEPIEAGEYQPDHSMDTVIVSVVEGTSKERMEEIFAENSLTIRYDYDFISAYAVSLAEEVDDATLTKLIKTLEAYDEITEVSLDYIYHTCD